MIKAQAITVLVGSAAALSLIVLSCGRAEPAGTPVPALPTATPTLRAETAAPLRTAAVGTPTSTPVPRESKEALLDFAKNHRVITEAWEKLHSDLDAWRESLTPCDASSMELTLRRFAGDFIAVTEAVRELADKAIAGAEGEEGALRRLRDNWKPGDTAFLEEVDTERSAAVALRKEIEDALADLQVKTAGLSRSKLAAVASALNRLDSDWDEFHGNYDAFRAEEVELTSLETFRRLSLLVDEFSGIVAAVRQLRTPDATRQVALTLAGAAEDEDLALRKLRGAFEKLEEAPSEEITEPPQSPEAPLEESRPDRAPREEGGELADESTIEISPVEEETILVLRDRSLFDAFDARMVESNALRRQALQELADAVEGTSKDRQDAVQEFSRRYNLAVRLWDGFHRNYDIWRQSEGGCDRTEAAVALGGFVVRFDLLVNKVREMPRPAFLSPLGELFVEAAEREEEALRTLRNTWRPFDSEVYAVGCSATPHGTDGPRCHAR